MRRKILLITLTIAIMSITIPTLAKPTWLAQIQCEITDVQYDLPYIHVTFEGSAGGPGIKGGTVEGVDHLFIDENMHAHLNVYYTVTDKDGDQISFYVTGLSVPDKPGKYIFVDAEAVVIDSMEYPTTGKFFTMIGKEFYDEGFITDFSDFPPGGYIHAKLYPK
jgi:hypothetical protein